MLGANDGIVSTSSLIIGVAAAGTTEHEILLSGVAGLVAGAMSMAAGEYVSVCSQADTEKADLEIERKSIEEDRESEVRELAQIYERRGVSPGLAQEVAVQLMAHDALGAHARDDIGITEVSSARPFQAAAYSAVTFSVGAACPLVTAWLTPLNLIIPATASLSLVFLTALGMISAFVGGAPPLKSAIRVTFWGAFAMTLTATIGRIFGVAT